MKLVLTLSFLIIGIFSFGQNVLKDSINPVPLDEPAVELFTTNFRFFAPNAFSPNGDLQNDTWSVIFEGVSSDNFHLVIYDRTGNLVWQTNDPFAAWDGTFNGVPLETDFCFWKVSLINEEGMPWESSGFITLIR